MTSQNRKNSKLYYFACNIATCKEEKEVKKEKWLEWMRRRGVTEREIGKK